MMSISAHESKSIVIFRSEEISVASVCMRKPVATFGFISSSSWPNKDPTLFPGDSLRNREGFGHETILDL